MGCLGDETATNMAMWFYPKLLGSTNNNNPSQRWGHSACFSDGLVYIFGGCSGGLHFSDIQILNPETMSWNTLVTSGQAPGARDSHSAVVLGRKMYVFGGTNGSRKVNDLNIFDFVTKKWSSPECKGTPPCPRESHTATLIGDNRMIIFGGSGEGVGNYLNDLHILDLKTMRWSCPEVKGEVPVSRDSHSAVAIGNELFVYGGDRGDRFHGDVDVLDTGTMTWTKLNVQGCSPGARAGHASVNIGNKFYVIGGVGDRRYYNDVWVLDVVACSWTRLDIWGQQPQGRFSHTAVVTDSDIAIYGGCGEDERPLNELLILQLRPTHRDNHYKVSKCKIFGKHWNQISRGEENNVRKGGHGHEPELKQAFWSSSDIPYPKRKRTGDAKTWEVESEQEEHSLSLSQHSSPSQSDQEQITPITKAGDSIKPAQGYNLFNKLTQIPRTRQPNCLTDYKTSSPYNLQSLKHHKRAEQFLPAVHTGKQEYHHFPVMDEKRKVSPAPIRNLIGAEVRGRVDGAFDSGLLMTANVNGKIFRGVLFAPANEVMSRGSIPGNQLVNVQPFSQVEAFKPLRQPSAMFPASESGQSFRQIQTSSTHPVIRGGVTQEPKQRNDLQGVVLTLGGPTSGHVGKI